MTVEPSSPTERITRAHHWYRVWRDPHDQASWYESVPTASLVMIQQRGPTQGDPVIDVGGGASFLADHLLAKGLCDVTVLDISEQSLALTRHRNSQLRVITGDVRTWQPARRYALWHDRAVFHFMATADDQQAYIDTLRRAIAPAGTAIIATFAPDGPSMCSGLPVYRYGAAQLADRLGKGFRLQASQQVEHHTPSGAVQPFTYTSFMASG